MRSVGRRGLDTSVWVMRVIKYGSWRIFLVMWVEIWECFLSFIFFFGGNCDLKRLHGLFLGCSIHLQINSLFNEAYMKQTFLFPDKRTLNSVFDAIYLDPRLTDNHFSRAQHEEQKNPPDKIKPPNTSEPETMTSAKPSYLAFLLPACG